MIIARPGIDRDLQRRIVRIDNVVVTGEVEPLDLGECRSESAFTQRSSFRSRQIDRRGTGQRRGVQNIAQYLAGFAADDRVAAESAGQQKRVVAIAAQQRVRTGAARNRVISGIADDGVVAPPAVQVVVSRTTDNRIVAAPEEEPFDLAETGRAIAIA